VWRLALVLCLGCGRIGFDDLTRRSPDVVDPDATPQAGASAGMNDASTRNDGGGASTDADGNMQGRMDAASDARTPFSDASATPGDASPPPSEAATDAPSCSGCELSESCVAGSCVSECASTYADALDCQGFEEGLTNLTYNAGVSEETGIVHAGSASIRTESSGASVSSRVSLPVSPTQNNGTLYFRAYYYIETAPTDGLIKLLGLDSAPDSNVDLNVNPDRSFDLYFHEMGGARINSQAGRAVFGAWMCLQVALAISDTVGRVTVTVDGTEALVSPSDRDTQTATGITRAEIGIPWSETSGATVVIVDDVVLDTAPVPCH